MNTAATKRRRRRSIVNKGLVTLVCVLVTCVLGHFMRHAAVAGAWPCTLASLFYIFLVINAVWLFCICAPYARIKIINAIAFAVLFVWGCVLYFFSPVGDEIATGDETFNDKVIRQIEAPNRTLAAFFPSRGGFENLPRDRKQRMHYFVFHSFVIFYIAMLTFAIFGRGIVNRMSKWLTRWKRLNVFWGRSDAGLLLARSIIENTAGDSVFFVLQQRSGDGDEWRTLTKEIDQMGAMWSFSYESNAGEADVSRDTIAQTKGRRHFFMDESGHVNLSRADRLVKVLRDKKPSRSVCGFFSALRAGVLQWWLGGCREKPYFYVRVETTADEFVCLEWAANVRDVVTPILVREPSLIAKHFIEKYPMLDAPGVKIDTCNAVVSDGEFKTLIVGFGATGQAILNEVVCNGQFLREDGKQVPFSVDVVEMDRKVVEEYRIRHPEVGMETEGRHYSVNFVEGARVEDQSFDDWFKGHLDLKRHMVDYNRIIVCVRGDDKTLGIASKIVEFSRRFGVVIDRGIVFARVRDPSRNRYVPRDQSGKMSNIYAREGQKQLSPVTLFGNLNEIYSFARMDVESVDRMAKVLNSRHGDFGREVSDAVQMEEDWDKASVFDQLSSRAAAEGQRNLQRLLGWKSVGRHEKANAEVPESKLKAIKEEGSSVLLTLARTEHLRWNAFHRMMGYRVWDVLDRADAIDDLPMPRKIKANQLEAIGKHADIVPFDSLPDVDMKLAAWKTGRSDLDRDDYVGLKRDSSQAWDIAFCQIMDVVAAAAGMKIVEYAPLS